MGLIVAGILLGMGLYTAYTERADNRGGEEGEGEGVGVSAHPHTVRWEHFSELDANATLSAS